MWMVWGFLPRAEDRAVVDKGHISFKGDLVGCFPENGRESNMFLVGRADAK